MIDFTQLGIDVSPKPINPRDIFMRLPQKESKYQYPRDVQGEVWKQWFEVRNRKDNIIKMNTGSGKTIVALMILQSCINENVGPAMYVVPDKYLVEQVIGQAKELGIKTVTSESDLDYQRKRAILVTSIQKLVNGKSVFGIRDDKAFSIGSVIIDDIHACVGTIQEQFSLTIDEGNEIYQSVINLFSEAMKAQSEERFGDIVSGRNDYDSMLVPFWNWQDKCSDVYRILSNHSETEEVQFKWNLIKDSLKLSHCYISSKSLSIIPNCIPIQLIRSFDDAKRRIYMSATLPDDSPFVTVLGIDVNEEMKAITPEKANDIGERLIIIPKIINKELTENEIRDALIQKAKEYNVIVLVPSFSSSKYWEDKGGVVLSSNNISEGIDKIKSNTYGLYVIVNRYDGIDLPDDACRILVIDGLPNIRNMDDKYENEVVRKSKRIQRELIQRIEQGMGRGVRSHNDYCLIYLLGNQLTNVLYLDEGYNFFSGATKAQFELSEKLCDQIEGKGIEDIFELGDFLLKRNRNWIDTCKNVTSDIGYDASLHITEQASVIRSAFDSAIKGDYTKSEMVINEYTNKEKNLRTRGYYKQLLAEYVNLTDKNKAQTIIKSAKKDNIDVLNPIDGIQFNRLGNSLIEQAGNMISHINELGYDANKLVMYVDGILEDLRFIDNSSKRFENAIKDLFYLIGFEANQPERETGKGPDDFVSLGMGKYLVIECKNETITNSISKHDCNQLNGSITWFYNLYKDNNLYCVPLMIHNSNIFDYECSPDSSIRIITPGMLDKFKKNVRLFFAAMCKSENYMNKDRLHQLIIDYSLNQDVLVKEYTTSFRLLGGN